MNVGGEPRPSENRLITTAAWKLGCAPTQYALEGSVFIAGAVVQWLRDQMGFIKSASEIEALAREVPDSGGVWFVPAFVGLGALIGIRMLGACLLVSLAVPIGHILLGQH